MNSDKFYEMKYYKYKAKIAKLQDGGSRPHGNRPHGSPPRTSPQHTSRPHGSHPHGSPPHTSPQHTSRPHGSHPHDSRPHGSSQRTSSQCTNPQPRNDPRANHPRYNYPLNSFLNVPRKEDTDDGTAYFAVMPIPGDVDYYKWLDSSGSRKIEYWNNKKNKYQNINSIVKIDSQIREIKSSEPTYNVNSGILAFMRAMDFSSESKIEALKQEKYKLKEQQKILENLDKDLK